MKPKSETLGKLLEFARGHVYFLLGGACLLIVGLVYLSSGRFGGAEESGGAVFIPGASEAPLAPQTEEDEPAPETAAPPVTVHVVGEVARPGVYTLEAGARIHDALAAAGGATAAADLRRLNLAAVAADAMQIIVPAFGEDVAEVFVHQDGGGRHGGLIDINSASAQELQALPGVGPALSEAIVSFRESHGRFATVDELAGVPRIGPATLERLRPLVVARN